MFARALLERLPLLPVEEEGRLNDPRLRESFVERLFTHARWRDFVAGRPTRGGLAAFHTAHKLLILAHVPAAYARLGRIVARAKERPLRDVLAEYGAGLMAALAVPGTPARHVNVLEHMLGYFTEQLGPDERHVGSPDLRSSSRSLAVVHAEPETVDLPIRPSAVPSRAPRPRSVRPRRPAP